MTKFQAPPNTPLTQIVKDGNTPLNPTRGGGTLKAQPADAVLTGEPSMNTTAPRKTRNKDLVEPKTLEEFVANPAWMNFLRKDFIVYWNISEQEVDDIVQECILQMKRYNFIENFCTDETVENIGKFQKKRANFKTYLRSMVRSVACASYRTKYVKGKDGEEGKPRPNNLWYSYSFDYISPDDAESSKAFSDYFSGEALREAAFEGSLDRQDFVDKFRMFIETTGASALQSPTNRHTPEYYQNLLAIFDMLLRGEKNTTIGETLDLDHNEVQKYLKKLRVLGEGYLRKSGLTSQEI